MKRKSPDPEQEDLSPKELRQHQARTLPAHSPSCPVCGQGVANKYDHVEGQFSGECGVERRQLFHWHVDRLTGKPAQFRTGFIDCLMGCEHVRPTELYAKGYGAASAFLRKVRRARATAELRERLTGRKFKDKHIGYHWAGKDGTSIEVASLDEIEAKDALCACLDLISKISGKANELVHAINNDGF